MQTIDDDGNATSDHIIPTNLFEKGDPDRPQLLVHDKCNNDKSKDDKWFVKQVHLRSSINPEAEKKFGEFIDKANSEKPDAYIIGKKVSNYILAKGLFKQLDWGIEIRHKGQDLIQLKFDKEVADRFESYVKNMSRGLYMLNVPGSNPTSPELTILQNGRLELLGRDEAVVKSVSKLFEAARPTRFGQAWRNVIYIGSRVHESNDKGFVFLMFYKQLCALVTFW